MATRDVVPRADGEGNIGTTLKKWLKGWFGTVHTTSVTNGTLTALVSDLVSAVSLKHTQGTDADLSPGHIAATTGVHGVGAGTVAKIGDVAVDANLSASAQAAIAAKHTQGTDQGLDTGGANAVVVADVKDAVTKRHVAVTVGAGLSVAGQLVSLVNYGSVNPTNLLANGSMESWSAGTAVAPDAWVLGGASAAVAKYTLGFKIGPSCARLTRAGTDCFLRQQFDAPKGILYFQGRTATLGCWVYADTAGTAFVMLYDGLTSTYSAIHSGGASWEWLTVTKTMAAGASGCYAYLGCNAHNVAVYFDGAIVVEGDRQFSFSDNPHGTPLALGTVASVLTANKGCVGASAAVVGWISVEIGGAQHFIPYW